MDAAQTGPLPKPEDDGTDRATHSATGLPSHQSSQNGSSNGPKAGVSDKRIPDLSVTDDVPGTHDVAGTDEVQLRSSQDQGATVDATVETTLPDEQSAQQVAIIRPRRLTWPSLTRVDGLLVPLTKLFDAMAAVRLVALVLVAIVAVTAFLPGFMTIPPIDRDESRFSQATRQMVATGDYIDIRFQSEPRYQKPIGIYWFQSAAVQLYDTENGQAPIWVYRTVSFAGAVVATLLVYWLALGFGPPGVALAAALLVGLTILMGAEARLAKTDAVLFATILAAQTVLAKAFISKRDSGVRFWHAALFWTATAVGILVKGPILPMVVGTTAIAASLIDRKIIWLRRLRPGLGVFWMLVLTLPWFITIGIVSAGEFFAESIGRDLFEKIGESRERPFVPPGVFALGFFPSLGWPLAPLAYLSIPFAIATWRDKGTRFLIAWILPTWLIFELSATKLPHYILPIYPALAILAARMLVFEKVPTGWVSHVLKGLFLLIPVAAVVGIPITLLVFGDGVNPIAAALSLLALALLVGAYLVLVRGYGKAALPLMVVGTLLLYASAFGSHIPSARTIWITPQLVTAAQSAACENPQLATLGYNEPSLVLMTRTDLRFLDGVGPAAEFLTDGGCRVAFIEARFVEALYARVSEQNATNANPATSVRLLARVEGLNFNGGDWLDLHVLAAGEGQ
ncbi:MAG: glycosyltransferase family 39 protein [Pseudomonadota bacterium]